MFINLRRKFLFAVVTAIAVLTTSLATAENVDNNYLNLGKQYYNRGQYAQAVQLWQQVAKQDSEIENKVLGYNYLAIAYQDLGQWQKALRAIASAFELLETTDNSFLYAQVLNTQGSLQLKTGNAENALETWKQAEAIYRSLDEIQPLLRSQINQAQALRTLGFYRRAKTILEQANEELNALPDSLLKAKALQSLGVTLRVIELSESEAILKQSLLIAQLKAPREIESIQISLANTVEAKEDYETAQAIYQQIRATATDKKAQIEISLNLLDLLIKTEQTDAAIDLLPSIQSNLTNLQTSLWSVYARVNLATSMMKIRKDKWHSPAIQNLLTTALQQAQELNDTKAKSYVFGQLGYFYEQKQQWTEALKLTQQAILLAQNSRATDLAANWYWQQGRILKAQGKIEQAIAAYEQAVATLQSLRQDLVAVSPDVRFSFRDEVEPVYRQLVQLLLKDVDSLPQATKQERLKRSREAIESLQLAELENFFREACVVYQPRAIEEIDPKAAVIYPILLEDRIEVILSVPNQPLQHYGNRLTSTEKEQIFREINQTLNPVFLPDEVLPPAQQLYDWLIRPGKARLEQQGIKTLVFVLDDLLRSIPMSVLHDGKNYLIEKYNIALTPGLQLLESPNAPKKVNALTAGLTAARQGFPPLPKVKQELEQISNLISSQILLDASFTRSDFQTEIEQEPFSIVHLATHGQFSSKAEDTFLLTWSERLNVKDLGNVLQQKRDRNFVELLVLSACETAAGDSRAALGMAGVAVRSGARSTIATLWTVQDDSTAQLMTEFYRRLSQSDISKAEALRQAQLFLLNNPKYNHPYYWSPFVLIGNWR